MRSELVSRCLAVAVLLALGGCGQSATSTDSTNPPAERAAEKAPPKPIVIEAGTAILVTLDQSVSSKNNSGDHFDASLAAPITVDGREVIAKGARISGTVTEAKSAGHFKGGAMVALSLNSITVHGEKYPIRTTTVEEAGKGRGKRTAIGTGGGAALGAVVGAIAGGGKGAAIGAAAGAGAGAAGAGLTGNRDIVLPAETKLHFKLAEPLKITRK